MTGIFLRHLAEAAEEERLLGEVNLPPWWRVIKTDGSLNPKLPGGGDVQAARLIEEGHRIAHRGRKSVCVEDYRNRLTFL